MLSKKLTLILLLSIVIPLAFMIGCGNEKGKKDSLDKAIFNCSETDTKQGEMLYIDKCRACHDIQILLIAKPFSYYKDSIHTYNRLNKNHKGISLDSNEIFLLECYIKNSTNNDF